VIVLKRNQLSQENFRNLKSRGGFEKWTFLKMSKIEKLKKVLKKLFKKERCDENADKTILTLQKSVTIKFSLLFLA